MAKKNRFVADVPGETAEDRLQHYIQQAQAPVEQRAKAPADQRGKAPAEQRARAPVSGGTGDAAPRERTFASKMFGVGTSGWVQLVLVCIAVGAIAEASGINPFSPTFSLNGAATAAMTGALNVLGWAMQAGWRPLVTGAVVVLPIWLLWRLASAGFRR